jgi:two-component system, NarL family, nitrate/nitrite response regulator NarL
MAIKLVLVESQRIIREALQCLIQATGDVIVVGMASRPQEILDVVDAHQPDVVLLTLDGRCAHDVALLKELPAVSERARTLVLAPDADAGLQARAIQLGAMGVVLKTESAHLLMKAVQKIHEGQLWLEREKTADVVKRLLTIVMSGLNAVPESEADVPPKLRSPVTAH